MYKSRIRLFKKHDILFNVLYGLKSYKMKHRKPIIKNYCTNWKLPKLIRLNYFSLVYKSMSFAESLACILIQVIQYSWSYEIVNVYIWHYSIGCLLYETQSWRTRSTIEREGEMCGVPLQEIAVFSPLLVLPEISKTDRGTPRPGYWDLSGLV